MKFLSKLKSIKIVEIVALVLFILYLVFPVSTPGVVAPYIESPIGMVVIFSITVLLFVYSHPVLAVLYIFVAYELLRRSSKVVRPSGQSAYIQYTQPEQKKEAEMKDMNEKLPIEQTTLEETVVSKMAPIGKSEVAVFAPSSFKPVATNVNGASPI